MSEAIDYFHGCNEILDEIFTRYDNGDNSAWEAIEEYGEIEEEFICFDIMITNGGPNVWLEVKATEANELVSVDYHYSYGYVHETRQIVEDDPMWRLAEHYILKNY